MHAIATTNKTQVGLIGLYLAAIITANVALAITASIWVMYLNAILFIGLNLTTKDYLQDAWQGRLKRNMGLLILSGSLLSVIMVLLLPQAPQLNIYRLAGASFLSFLISESGDAWRYQQLIHLPRFERINKSNLVGAGLDSFFFPLLAFGWPLLWWVVLGQFVAKVGGGYIWSLILFRRMEPEFVKRMSIK